MLKPGHYFIDNIRTPAPCTAPGTHFERTQWWCGTHAPSKIAERKQKRELNGDVWRKKLRQATLDKKLADDQIKLCELKLKALGESVE